MWMYWKTYSCHFDESEFTVVGFNEIWKGRELKATLIFHCTKSNRVCHFISWYLSKNDKKRRKKNLWWFRWQMWNSDFLSVQPKYPQLSSQLIEESDAMTAPAPPYNTHTHTHTPTHTFYTQFILCMSLSCIIHSVTPPLSLENELEIWNQFLTI